MNRLFFILFAQLRLMNLVYHDAHNLASGPNFEGDHELFGEFYSAMDSDYDDVIERAIGLGMDDVANLPKQIKTISNKLDLIPVLNSSKERFQVGLSLEEDLCKICEAICDSEGVTSGVDQLVGDIANKSESRQYKIKQRIR